MKIIIIGAGVVGLAIAHEISQRINSRITIMEKENTIATHQSGRNSGVIHSGIYYSPGSLKATLCRDGKSKLEDFCTERRIPFKTVGKLIVATDELEVERLHKLETRAKLHGIPYELTYHIKDIEPAATGRLALHIPETGIVDYKEVCRHLAPPGTVRVKHRVTQIHGNKVYTTGGIYTADLIINCAGLYADRVMRLAGHVPDIQIVPFRGEYYTLRTDKIRGLIYPVPDPELPFLGVHFTKMIDGRVECGPNAVLALAREGYDRWQCRDAMEILSYPGTLKLMKKYWRTGIVEMASSLSKSFYLSRLRKLVPSIKMEDLRVRVPGIRAQAVNRDGSLVDDFVIRQVDNCVHILNAPSPAATASLAIAKYVVDGISWETSNR